MGYLITIQTAAPSFKHKQEDILSYMQDMLGNDAEREKRMLGAIYRRAAIDTRYSVLPDFNTTLQDNKLFSVEDVPAVDQRMQLFEEEALPLVADAAQKCLQEFDKDEITHLITVTCTGLSAPGLDVSLVEVLGLSPQVYRQSINFVGCYAAFHAIRQANDICAANPEANILIADVELCTIHFQNEKDEDNLMANALFGDGAAAAIVTGRLKKGQRGLQILENQSHLLLEGKKEMAWRVSQKGFLMTLTSYVPEIIEQDLGKIMKPVLEQYKKEDFLWAVHPGGKRILEKFEQSMEISKEDLKASYDVLKEYGNMSSCTILYVIKELWNKLHKTQKPLFSTGFGPGLTVETLILQAES